MKLCECLTPRLKASNQIKFSSVMTKMIKTGMSPTLLFRLEHLGGHGRYKTTGFPNE